MSEVWEVEDLLALGRQMDEKPAAVFRMARVLLKVRNREGVERILKANAVQRAFERERGRQNIVLRPGRWA